MIQSIKIETVAVFVLLLREVFIVLKRIMHNFGWKWVHILCNSVLTKTQNLKND